MAYLDDRLWCHSKVVDLSDRAFRAYINGLAYSSGFNLLGHLTPGHQRTIGATAKTRQELTAAGLWEPNGDGIYIHDWEDHNGLRDARKAADRERKRAERAAKRSAGQS